MERTDTPESVSPSTEHFVTKSGDKPNINYLIHAFEETTSDLGYWIDRQRDNYNIRHCIWDGQSDDGKKHGTENAPAFPWDGASDQKPMMVDQYITADKSLLTTSLKKANLVAVPVETGDMARAKGVTSFMRWMKERMVEFDDEAELAANYFLEKGICAVGIIWDRKISMVQETLTVQQLAEVMPDIMDLLADKMNTDDIADLLQTQYGYLKKQEAKKKVRELRENGETVIAVPEVEHERPMIRTYSFDNDIFVPLGTTDIQKAPYIFKRDWYSPEQLRAKVATEGWNRKFVEHIIDTQKDESGLNYTYQQPEWDARVGLMGNLKSENIGLVCAYYRVVNEDGIPDVKYTVFHPEVSQVDGSETNAYAIHRSLGYRPCRYPFVSISRERLSRRMLETRGYPEIAQHWQSQVKVEEDSRIDIASLITNPPLKYLNGREVKNFGAGARIPVRRMDELDWMQPPAPNNMSIEVENTIRKVADKYFGRQTDEMDGLHANIIRDDMISKWLGGFQQVYRHIWHLFKQYGPDEQYYRVTGTEPKVELMVKGPDNEKYDFYIAFDVPGLDPEYNLKKMEQIGKLAMTYDRTGITDWTAFYREMVSAVDPVVAERVLIPQEQATEKEMEEEKLLLTQMYSGMDVDLKPPFNAQLRMQVLQQYLQGSEEIPATDVQRKLQEDPEFAQRIQKHQKQLQMAIQQQQNAQIGRLGTAPGNM